MTTVRELLEAKDIHDVFTIGPDAPAVEAALAMAEFDVGALVVVEDGRVLGIVSERDYVRKIGAACASGTDTLVRDIMSSPVRVVHPAQTDDECMALITEYRLRHLPVMERGQLLGLVSIGDLVKDVISEQQFVIEQLEHYITAG